MDKKYWDGVKASLESQKQACQRKIKEIDYEIERIEKIKAMGGDEQ